MHTFELLSVLQTRHVKLALSPEGLRYEAPRGVLTPELRAQVVEHKAALVELLALEAVRTRWKAGEWLAFRDGGVLVAAKYAGVSTAGAVNVWLADGVLRAVQPETVALDWGPDGAELFEERIAIMLVAGVPEQEARVRAEQCTREYLERHTRDG